MSKTDHITSEGRSARHTLPYTWSQYAVSRMRQCAVIYLFVIPFYKGHRCSLRLCFALIHFYCADVFESCRTGHKKKKRKYYSHRIVNNSWPNLRAPHSRAFMFITINTFVLAIKWQLFLCAFVHLLSVLWPNFSRDVFRFNASTETRQTNAQRFLC